MASRTWDLSENPKSKRWFVNIPNKLDTESYPDVAAIRLRAQDKGIDQYRLMSDQALEKNVQKALSIAGEEFSFPIDIEPSFDVHLIISPDKTRANLYVRKAADKKTDIDLKLISTVINNARIKGVDAGKVKKTLDDFRASPAMELNDFVIAEGTPPGRGKNRELTAKISWLSDSDTAPIIERLTAFNKQHTTLTPADDAFPLSAAKHLCFVERGAVLYEISPAEEGTPGSDIYGKEIPGMPGNDPFVHIVENITLAKDSLKAEKTGVLIATEENDSLKLRVIPFVDGKTTPVISSDDMTVSLILENAEGAGLPPTVDAAIEQLELKGIKGDIDRDLIEKTIAEIRETKTGKEIVILEGKKPVPPGSFRITWIIKPPRTTATTDEKILSAEKLPAGADGCDVFGRKLPASEGKPEPAPEVDDSVSVETEGSMQIYVAKKCGELIFDDHKLSISDTKTVTSDIDEKTGDINFPGNLSITGKIASGRTVKVGGTLTITGNAEAAFVSADTTVTMNGGIAGAGRGIVWAKQEIRLTFAENARLLAGQNISIDNYCFQCTVKTNGTLFLRGNPGVLLGGSIRASRGVEVFELGSSKTIRTSISFGQNYLVSDQIEVCEKEVRKIKDFVDKLDNEMKKISNTDPRIHELRRKKLEALKRNDKLTVRIFTLKEQFETHIISHIRVENTVYPGVVLESHGRYLEIRETKNHVIFTFDQITGQIICNPIND
jgi:uncharacterized protein (DUF342 family)